MKQSMKKVLQKLIEVILVLLGVSLMTFVCIRLAPSDPAMVKIANSGVSVTPEVLQEMRHQLGLDQSWFSQYTTWLLQVLHGDLGVSLQNNQAIGPQLWAAWLNTMQLSVLSIVVSVVISVPVGFYFAKSKRSLFSRVVETISLIGIAIPSFVLAYVLMEIFSVQLHWFPLLAQQGGLGLVMPLLTLVIPISAKFIQQIASLVREEQQKSYVTALHYRGISPRKILYRHILKNIFPTVFTIVMLSFGSLLGGVIVVETIFYWPGIGKLLMDAINNRDYPVVQIVVCVISFCYLVISQLVDGFNHTMDPRMKGGRLHETR